MKSLIAVCLFLFTGTTIAQVITPWTNTGPVAFPINKSGQVHGIGRVSQLKFHPSNTSKMYAVSASGGLYITTNNGVTWAPTSGTEKLPATSCSAVCIDFTNDNIMYLSLGDADYYSNSYGVYKSTDGGATWNASNTTIGNKMCVEILMDPTDHNSIVAATSSGVWKSTNAGSTWTQKITGGAFRDMKANPLNGRTLFAATGTLFYKSVDFGETWTNITSGVTVPSGNSGMRIAVTASDSNRVYLGTTGGNGWILRSTDCGLNFTNVYNSTTQCLVCYDASVTSGSQGNYNFDINANPLKANELLLVAHNVWRSTDGGVTWSKRTSWWNECHTDMHQIDFNPYNNTQRFNSNDGGVWMSTDTVLTLWNPRSDGVAATEIYRAAQSPLIQQMISIGTQDNGELYYDTATWKCNRGGDWSAKCAFDYLGNSTVYYMNNGNRRNLRPLGGDFSYNCPYTATSASEIAFFKGLPNYAFLGKDSIWRSTNINNTSPTWTKILANSETIKDIVVCTADSNILYFVTNASHIYRCDNVLAATPTATMLSTPSATNVTASIATNKNNANIVYLACNNKVYVSTTQGSSWTDITSNLPSLNIRQIYHDDYTTNERLFVSMGNYVYYKNNLSPNWTNHATGLATVANVTDFMLFNDGTDKSLIRLSTYGRGVWESFISMYPPKTNYSVSDSTICAGTSVNFIDKTTNNAASWSWTFSGGTPSTSASQNPSVVYATAGTYQVKLVTTNAAGSDSLIKIGYIVVSPLPTVTITFNGTSLNASGATGTYVWLKDGIIIPGATSASYTPTQNGNYVVKVTDVNGCTGQSSIYALTNLGIKGLNKNDMLQVYPNPANDIIQIKVTGAIGSRATIYVYNIAGTLIYKRTASIRSGTLDEQYNIAELARGSYEIRVLTDAGDRFIKPLVLQ
jgi:photosystem II stability/assembly factor-like uncharacterized protein/PKD repeat protein